jgi:hypothetical protein
MSSSMYVYVCMYVLDKYIYIYIYIYTCVCIYIYICIFTRRIFFRTSSSHVSSVCMHVCMYVCMLDKHIYAKHSFVPAARIHPVFMCIRTCRYIYTHIYMYSVLEVLRKSGEHSTVQLSRGNAPRNQHFAYIPSSQCVYIYIYTYIHIHTYTHVHSAGSSTQKRRAHDCTAV